jgi:hypothetical protein
MLIITNIEMISYLPQCATTQMIRHTFHLNNLSDNNFGLI